ncbi:MAG: EF-P lysine aminoacylase GenX [Deltaproteobacteria bacterium]|nr:MAG: EF-P lysine aminoacylase GenX [Deltaproteobacteria bacterium]
MINHRQKALLRNLQLRARIIQAIRRFFIDNDYLEVETPCRIPAPAPEENIDAQPSGYWYLHTSPELFMKRLLAAGYPRIFQICKCFRQNERGSKHLPELTMLEWYTAGSTYLDVMDQCEELVQFVARNIGYDHYVSFQGSRISLKPPWPKALVTETFDQFASLPMEVALRENRFDELMGLEIEPRLGLEKPVFIYDYPASCAALARLKPDDRSVAERFELYIGGLELCNGFSELTDPVEQKMRFEWEQERRRFSGKAPYPMPKKFLNALPDMPDAGGNAFGIDRLVMLFADTLNIDDVVAFTPEEL